jgi:hypothetical protein
LIDWIDYKYPVWKNRVFKFLQTRNLKSAFALNLSRRLSRPLLFAIHAPEIMRLLDPAAADAAVPGLAKLLHSPKPGVPDRARDALVQLGPKGLPPLIAGLSEGPTSNRIACAKSISRMRTNAAPAVPGLVRCLRDPDFAIRDCIRIALEQVDADPALVLPELTNIVADPKLRYTDIIQYLGSIRHAASNAVPAFYLAMTDPNPEIRQAACFAFIRTVCNAHQLDGYEDLSGSPMRTALDRLNGDPAPMIAALTDIVDDPHFRNDSALDCLASFGPTATNAVPVLRKALRYSYDPKARSNISNALERIAPSALPVPFVSNAVHFSFQ